MDNSDDCSNIPSELSIWEILEISALINRIYHMWKYNLFGTNKFKKLANQRNIWLTALNVLWTC